MTDSPWATDLPRGAALPARFALLLLRPRLGHLALLAPLPSAAHGDRHGPPGRHERNFMGQ
jgi:hypothetical protein